MKKDIFSPEKYLPGHTVTLVASGTPYFEHLLEIIDKAQQEIQFQVYIFDDDGTGRAVAVALKKAQDRGVKVFLAVDSYGSKEISPAFVADLKGHGIHFKVFSPLPRHFYAFRFGRRLHIKVVVADGAVALVGGINIADKYAGTADVLPWLDFAILVEGPVCADLSNICARIYYEKYFGRLKSALPKKQPQPAGKVRSRFALNDWFRQKNQVSNNYSAAFRMSQSSISIMASYFLPGRKLRYVLKEAARRGVDIRLLLPNKSDVAIAKRATRFLYRWLLRNNIQIYEWDKSVLHGKMAVVDNKWVTIGSYNLNHLSKFSSIELNVEVMDAGFGASVQEQLSDLMAQSSFVNADTFELSRGVWYQFLDWVSYLLARWVMLLLFYFIRREEHFQEKD